MINLKEAETLALDFLMDEWDLSEQERTWFIVQDSRAVPDTWWYVVEIGLKNLPDKWVFQVYEEGECDPCYTFVSPFSENDQEAHLSELPQPIAVALKQERCGHI